MTDSDVVLVQGGRGESDLTSHVISSVASAFSWLLVPCTLVQYMNLEDQLRNAWRSGSHRQRRLEQRIAVDWVQAWSHMQQQVVDREAIVAELRRAWYSNVPYNGPAVMQWAYELDQAAQQKLADGPPPLMRQAAQAHVEASQLGGVLVQFPGMLANPTVRRAVVSGHAPEIRRAWVSWLVDNWAAVLRAGDGAEVTTAPEWWYSIWAAGATPSASWVYERPVLQWIATHAVPGFGEWWRTERPKMELERNRTTQAEVRVDHRNRAQASCPRHGQQYRGRPPAAPRNRPPHPPLLRTAWIRSHLLGSPIIHGTGRATEVNLLLGSWWLSPSSMSGSWLVVQVWANSVEVGQPKAL
jgi:hypothetical protein